MPRDFWSIPFRRSHMFLPTRLNSSVAYGTYLGCMRSLNFPFCATMYLVLFLLSFDLAVTVRLLHARTRAMPYCLGSTMV